MIDIRVAFDKLAGFQTPDELKDYLKSEGIFGVRGDNAQCPIANWMHQTTGDDRILVGSSISIWETENVEGGWKEELRIPVTDVISDFIEMFDEGMFPELIAEAEDDYYE